MPAYDVDDAKALPRYARAREAAEKALAIDPTMARQLLSLLRQAVERAAAKGYQPVLMVSATVRGQLRRFVEQTLASLAVVSPQEIAPQTRLQGLETVAMPDG